MFPLNQIAHVGVSQSRGLKLFGREVILEEFQPMSSLYLIVTDGQTDRQADGQTKEISIPRYALVHRAVKTSVIGLQFCRWMYGSIFKFVQCTPKEVSFLKHGAFGLSRSSKVNDLDTNRKHICHFLLVPPF